MVYLLCLRQPYKGKKHYAGFCFDKHDALENRLQQHADSWFEFYPEPITTEAGKVIAGKLHGDGSHFLAAVNTAGIPWTLARVWMHADRNFERRLKDGKNLKYACPNCNPKHAYTRYQTPT